MKNRMTKTVVAGTVACLLAAVAMPGCSSTPKSTAQAPLTAASAATMVNYGAGKMESLMGHSQTEALKNMLGGARGVFVAPYVTGEAALLGTENGTGYLLRRHGKEWSDPVFFKMTEFSLGYQGGAKESHMIILLMTDEAVDGFVKGTRVIGGTGGFALGSMGVGASGAGGIKGGLEQVIICTSEGVFLGGGMSTMTPAPVKVVNDAIYGAGAEPAAILAGNGGKFVPAADVRARLSDMVVKAWGVSN